MSENTEEKIFLPEDKIRKTPVERHKRLAYEIGLHPDSPDSIIREKLDVELLNDLLYENGFDLKTPTPEQIAFCIRQMMEVQRMFPNESK